MEIFQGLSILASCILWRNLNRALGRSGNSVERAGTSDEISFEFPSRVVVPNKQKKRATRLTESEHPLILNNHLPSEHIPGMILAHLVHTEILGLHPALLESCDDAFDGGFTLIGGWTGGGFGGEEEGGEDGGGGVGEGGVAVGELGDRSGMDVGVEFEEAGSEERKRNASQHVNEIEEGGR